MSGVPPTEGRSRGRDPVPVGPAQLVRRPARHRRGHGGRREGTCLRVAQPASCVRQALAGGPVGGGDGRRRSARRDPRRRDRGTRRHPPGSPARRRRGGHRGLVDGAGPAQHRMGRQLPSHSQLGRPGPGAGRRRRPTAGVPRRCPLPRVRPGEHRLRPGRRAGRVGRCGAGRTPARPGAAHPGRAPPLVRITAVAGGPGPARWSPPDSRQRRTGPVGPVVVAARPRSLPGGGSRAPARGADRRRRGARAGTRPGDGGPGRVGFDRRVLRRGTRGRAGRRVHRGPPRRTR